MSIAQKEVKAPGLVEAATIAAESIEALQGEVRRQRADKSETPMRRATKLGMRRDAVYESGRTLRAALEAERERDDRRTRQLGAARLEIDRLRQEIGALKQDTYEKAVAARCRALGVGR